MESNPNEHMVNKVERVAELAKKVGVDMTLLNLTKIKVKSILH